MIKIVSKDKYNKLTDSIKQLKTCNKEMAKENGEKRKELNVANEKIQRMEIDNAALKDIQLIDEQEIKNKEEKIEELSKELSDRNQSLEKAIKEKEILSIRVSELKKYKKEIDGQKGGYLKIINDLNNKLDAKERVIEEYERALKDSEEKNQNQLNVIKDLTKKIEHKSIEYKNNGLSKQTKKAFKKGNKK